MKELGSCPRCNETEINTLNLITREKKFAITVVMLTYTKSAVRKMFLQISLHI